MFYGKQPSKNGYLKEDSWYPTIYELEKNSVINHKLNPNGLDLSDSNNKLIVNQVKKQAKSSIQPYKSFYNTVNYKMTVQLFGGEESIYKNIFLPNGTLTDYWIASRIIGNGTNCAHFDIRIMHKGFLKAVRLYDSRDIESGGESSIFPIVSVSIDSISGGDNGVFIVK